MKIGFTGTQQGMTQHQKEQFVIKLFELNPTEFHHGDCIGADAQAHDIVREFFPDCKIFIHPPKIKTKRAFKQADFLFEEKDYLERNHDIVDSTEYLIASPKSNTEELRSGTWATVRYGRKLKKPKTILSIE